MIGETVAVIRKAQTGKDALGNPTYSWERSEEVGGCLVHTASSSDLTGDKRPYGTEVLYSIAFPKSYAGGSLRGCRVSLVDRGMADDDALYVIGDPDYEAMAPTSWNMLVDVGRQDG